MSKLSKAERDIIKAILEKHQKKHPGCRLNERVCRSKVAEDCIEKGDISKFHKTGATCKRCISVLNRAHYEKVTVHKRAEAREKARKAERRVTFDKSTKKK